MGERARKVVWARISCFAGKIFDEMQEESESAKTLVNMVRLWCRERHQESDGMLELMASASEQNEREMSEVLNVYF